MGHNVSFKSLNVPLWVVRPTQVFLLFLYGTSEWALGVSCPYWNAGVGASCTWLEVPVRMCNKKEDAMRPLVNTYPINQPIILFFGAYIITLFQSVLPLTYDVYILLG